MGENLSIDLLRWVLMFFCVFYHAVATSVRQI